MLQNIIVIFIVCIAVLFVIRKIHGVLSGRDPGCGCESRECPGCGTSEERKVSSCGCRTD